MNKHKLNMLSNELSSAGANSHELPSLLRLADDLTVLRHSHAAAAKPLLPRSRSRWLLPSLSSACFLLLGMGVVMLAQPSLPGNWLYPVKRLSEQTAVLAQPGYRATIMMHRAEEVHSLVAHHASSQKVLATLAAYQSDATAYRSTPGNYSAFEYCKSSLRQAETQANAQEQQAIKTTLASLEDV